ncbi:hypothetical protein C7212DRAFT_342902 [Tuber magnatum]|uniref:Uncharacterized protein n=1 Tax=Tuber magnatum TaxID=42249 RepID=A0A317SW45_9PEZI|nr:hypothetical protein C7212DRAFT_342902 [Tuber magnatum]
METPREPDTQNSKFTEYGEARVILVRDEETRDQLRMELGRSSLVLTILQSKGMEFEDVFLYNFLSTSPYSYKLDILEDLFKEKHGGSGISAYRDGYTNLAKGDVVLCSELKVSEMHRRLSAGRTISASELREMGYQMIDDEQYSEALRCFEGAEDSHGITLASAYITEEIGLTNRVSGSYEAAKLNFVKASVLFLQAGSIAKAVECRKEGGDPKGTVKILVDIGEYEEAAWLAADLGLFSETSEIYTKLNKHEKALAGYARAENCKWMFNYIRKFKSGIEPNCRRQYAQFGYLKEFGGCDTIADRSEKRVIDLIGSPVEQKMALLRFGLVHKLFELLSTRRKYTEAYEVGVSSGILEGSIGLLYDKILPEDPNWGQGTGKISDVQIDGYVDILAMRRAYPNNEYPLPLDHIERVLEDLRIITSSHERIPSAVQLYSGIYEIPRQPGKYIVLEWSPFSTAFNPRLPLRPADIDPPLRGRILEYILRDIVPPLVSLDQRLRIEWSDRAGPRFAPMLTLGYSAMIKDHTRLKDSLPWNWDWNFWRIPLLEQMEFRSPQQQSLAVLLSTKSELIKREGRYHALYSDLIEGSTTEDRIKSVVQMGVGACVSSLLAQYQTSLFLGYEGQWKSAFRETRGRVMNRGSLSLKYGSEIVTLVDRFLLETGAGDFPGRFCENISAILHALGRAKSSLNFYSASVISLYEELALSLIFLVRPYEFLVPESWHRLYFNRWEEKPRSPSVLKRFQYQQCLAKVCLRFCEMTLDIERRPTKEVALARRSVTLIVVFRCGRLNASGIRILPGDKLIGGLAEVFQQYGGNDSICLVWGRPGRVDSFAGFRLKRSGISVVKSHPIEERERHQWEMSSSQHTRRLNAAHVLTAFWKLNGPRFMEMKERRRLNAYCTTAVAHEKGTCFDRDASPHGNRNYSWLGILEIDGKRSTVQYRATPNMENPQDPVSTADSTLYHDDP